MVLKTSGFESGASSTDEEEEVRRIQHGDERAWADFLARHSDLIFTKASQYCRLSNVRAGVFDWRDERDELYLFMAQALRRSLNSFRMTCQPRTWVFAVIGSRKQVVKAYLLHKTPARADVRLPKIMESRSALEKQIFKRLIWGIDPAHIALELQTEEDRCAEVEALLRHHSPRVYERILGNRVALEPTLSVDDVDERGGARLEFTADAPNPEELFETKAVKQMVQQSLADALDTLTIPERRVLILLYSHDMSAADIVALAASDHRLLDGEIGNVNQCYYIKDRALEKIASVMTPKLVNAFDEEWGASHSRRVLKCIEALLKERGFPASRLDGC